MKKWFLTYTIKGDRPSAMHSIVIEAVNRPKAVAKLKEYLPKVVYNACSIIDCIRVNEG